MKIRPVASQLCHTDRWTDLHTNRHTYMNKLIADFRNFSKAPKQLILNFLYYFFADGNSNFPSVKCFVLLKIKLAFIKITYLPFNPIYY
jgi:hypothetical protein